MHHQDRHLGAVQHALGETAEDPFTQSAMAVGAHDDEGAFGGGGREQSVGGA
jgi:hypothetical protein